MEALNIIGYCIFRTRTKLVRLHGWELFNVVRFLRTLRDHGPCLLNSSLYWTLPWRGRLHLTLPRSQLLVMAWSRLEPLKGFVKAGTSLDRAVIAGSISWWRDLCLRVIRHVGVWYVSTWPGVMIDLSEGSISCARWWGAVVIAARLVTIMENSYVISWFSIIFFYFWIGIDLDWTWTGVWQYRKNRNKMTKERTYAFVGQG